MLRFFRINDPVRLFALLGLLLVVRLPMFIYGSESADEANWLALGSALRLGSMYVDVWDSTAPISAFVYYFIVLLFGKSFLALKIFGAIVTGIHIHLFNSICIKNKLLGQANYIPGFVYMLFSSLHTDFMTLSPVFMGMTFILMALNNLLSHVEFRAKRDEHLLYLGLLIGIAPLFYFPLIIFSIIILFLLLVFTNTLQRRYLLIIYGSVLPLLASYFYYWVVSDDSGYFMHHFIVPELRGSGVAVGLVELLLVMAWPLGFSILGSFGIAAGIRLTSYQIRVVQLIALFGIASPLLLFIAVPDIKLIYILLPAFAFFTAQLFQNIGKSLVSHILIWVFILGSFFINYNSQVRWVSWMPGGEEPLQVENTQWDEIVEEKDILVFGSQPSLYLHGNPCTAFLDWGLSKRFFDEIGHYDNIVFLYIQIKEHPPEVIVDLENKWPEITKHLPTIAESYKRDSDGVYVRAVNRIH